MGMRTDAGRLDDPADIGTTLLMTCSPIRYHLEGVSL
jgi:hypothetical protein